MTDPVEKIVRDALDAANLFYVEEEDPRARRLDFYLPVVDVYIEVKQFHTDRISEQMSRAPNVIAIQGIGAAKLFAQMLTLPHVRSTREERECRASASIG